VTDYFHGWLVLYFLKCNAIIKKENNKSIKGRNECRKVVYEMKQKSSPKVGEDSFKALQMDYHPSSRDL